MLDLQTMAINLLKAKASQGNNPNAEKYIEVIQNGDSAQGSQIAENLCKTYGVSKEEAISRAKAFFNIP